MNSSSECNVPNLPLLATIGYEGKVRNGLHTDRFGQSLIYVIGSNIVKANPWGGVQNFMIGHGNKITCIDVDPCGRFIASGQLNYMGFKANVIIWDNSTGCKLAQYDTHLTRVSSLSFSPDGKYLMSVGNLDDGHLCVFDTEKCQVISGGKTSTGVSGIPRTCVATNNRNDAWVVGGDDYLGVWILDTCSNRLRYEKANLRKTKRDILTIQIEPNDQYAYCGTGTGDAIKIKLNLPNCGENRALSETPALSCLVTRKPKKCEKGRNLHLYKGGITALKILKGGDFLIGTGCGVVVQCKLICACTPATPPTPTEAFVEYGEMLRIGGKITSILTCEERAYIGTTQNEIYITKLGSLDSAKMVSSAHNTVVNDIAFPRDFSQVFASGNFEDVRIWNAMNSREIVRIHVANMTCQAVIFSNDGRSIISGWTDSHVRAFTPQSGTALWLINHAHLRGVSALAISSDDKRLITGGDEGQVRVWSLCPQQFTPIAIMKEHRGPITGLRMKSDNTQVASSSGDGSIIIWDLGSFVRKVLILQDTLFLDVAWHPSNCQILGVTHNHKLCYFEVFDGSSIREISASESDPVHSLDISPDGQYVVTAGGDRQVKLWAYREGNLLRVGSVHSSEVTRVRFSPCSDYILSSCQDGSIFKWDFPKDLCTPMAYCFPGEVTDMMNKCNLNGNEGTEKARDLCPVSSIIGAGDGQYQCGN